MLQLGGHFLGGPLIKLVYTGVLREDGGSTVGSSKFGGCAGAILPVSLSNIRLASNTSVFGGLILLSIKDCIE